MKTFVMRVVLALAVIHAAAEAAYVQNKNPSRSTQMSKQYIRDNNFRVIGSIDTFPDGKQCAYDAKFRNVGTYDSRADRTHDASFRSVGNGNQLVGLIWEAAGK
ncbi:hypothetical protein PQR75_01085 [Paraburkholderia fungorum]|uniref:hypothetical protein n=1 Tax=Paraburkholderia fungorum TaxID=134537 RepID=UPI0038B993FD